MRGVPQFAGACLVALLLVANGRCAQPEETELPIRDLASVEGVRENPLIGYGMVVGLAGTGDRQQTIFTTQTLGNILQKMGVQIPAASVTVKNVAAVFVTASLPPFARPGMRIDVTVSSLGDAKSLEGGTLLMVPLYGADGRVYAEAQGAVTLGGYTAGRSGSSFKQVNHPTAGRIPNGGLVERDVSIDLHGLTQISLLVRDPDFRVTRDMAMVINQEVGRPIAAAVDSARVDLHDIAPGTDIAALLARVLSLKVATHPRAKVVVSERNGTIVMGQDVRLNAVSILHGDLSIQISTEYQVSQPAPFSQGQTTVVPETTVKTGEEPAKHIQLGEGASVEKLVDALQAIGASARDVIAILQAIKAAGALQADLEVI
ncbi:MAG TPA: flagellar basal body P-ring protein FlgI [Bryocella sp.]|nr:flagellar basal body P-ring protein FlgI [Bryocella sp.]